MQHVNLFSLEYEWDDADPDGYRAGMARFGPGIGAVKLGGTVYELPEGQSICPYHYEYGDEEWVIVLEGRPTLRHPEGEDVLAPGDVVCFPEGPGGRTQADEHSRRASARAVALDEKQTGGRRLPRQRQDRRLAWRRARRHDGAA